PIHQHCDIHHLSGERRIIMATILLVEKEYTLAKTILQVLEFEGYQTWWAVDRVTALTIHAHNRIDLVILDWTLPDLSRSDMLQQTSGTPVIVLTGSKGEVDPVTALEAGADAYLTKPYGMRELVARVRALLRRAELVRQGSDMEAGETDEVMH